LAFVYLYTII